MNVSKHIGVATVSNRAYISLKSGALQRWEAT